MEFNAQKVVFIEAFMRMQYPLRKQTKMALGEFQGKNFIFNSGYLQTSSWAKHAIMLARPFMGHAWYIYTLMIRSSEKRERDHKENLSFLLKNTRYSHWSTFLNMQVSIYNPFHDLSLHLGLVIYKNYKVECSAIRPKHFKSPKNFGNVTSKSFKNNFIP